MLCRSSDQYMLQRVDFGKSFYGKSYSTGEASEANKGMFKGSLEAMGLLSKSLLPGNVRYMPDGFLEMMFIDPSGFDQQHYGLRRRFVRPSSARFAATSSDVHPKAGLGNGRFTGPHLGG